MANLKTRTIHRKGHLLQAGQISRHVYFINKGLLRSYYIEGGHEISSKFMKEGDLMVAGTSFFQQKESAEFIQAIENSLVFSICFDELQFAYKHFAELNIIARVLITRSYLLSEQRLQFIRMRQAKDRYKNMMTHFPDLVLRVPAKYIASYLSVSEETLSRIRSLRY
ncbi:MAG: Crp/Fnr family transcriptional regulator [Chitinophagaceae bacterium]